MKRLLLFLLFLAPVAFSQVEDPLLNFAKATVSTGYDASATSISVTSGGGARFPNPSTDGAFNLVWWNATDYADPSDDPNREIVRCTARSSDTFTITRGQEGTSATTKNTSSKTYKIILSITKKIIDDLRTGPADSAKGAARADSIVGKSFFQLSGSGTENMPFLYSTTSTATVPGAYYRVIEIQAGAINPGAGDLTGATALADDDDNTNDVTLDVLEFSATAENYVTFTVSMPGDWDASTAPKFKIIWYSGTGHASNLVNWEIATRWIRPSTDGWKSAYGTAASTTQTPTTADYWYITSAISPTPAGTAAAGATLIVRVMRDGDDGTNDTHTATAKLVKVLVQYKATTLGGTTSW